MKYATLIAATATGVFANKDSMQVKTFASTDCTGNALFDTTLAYGECTKVKNSINVEKLNNAEFSIVKKSGDHDFEFYLFPNVDSCENYGNKFNPKIEVAFIRAPGKGVCAPCTDCGSVGSLIIGDAKVEEKSDKPKTKAKVEESSASATAISASVLAASTAFAMLF